MKQENEVYTPVYTVDYDLKIVVDSWTKLTDEIKQTLLQIVKLTSRD